MALERLANAGFPALRDKRACRLFPQKKNPLKALKLFKGLTNAACAVSSLRWSHALIFLVFNRVAITTKTLRFIL